MMQLFGPTIAEQIAELQRELKWRSIVYPRQIAMKKLKQATADRRNECLRATLAVLEAQASKET